MLVRNRAIESSLSTLLRTLLAVGAAIIAASALLGVVLASRTLRPVERMRREVDDISGAELDRRIAEGRPDELGRLARAFNRLLARAERSTAEQQHFVADASHELRTPVTALQGHARIVVRAIDRGDLDQARESAEVVVAESRRLAATLSELLSLAESGGPDRPLEPVRLDAAAREACDEMRAFHDGRVIDTELAEVTVRADSGRLGELIRILVDNALKYSPPEMPVTVTVTDADGPSSPCATTDRASPRRIGSGPSTASTAARRRRASPAAGSAWRSHARSASATARSSSSNLRPAAGPSRQSGSRRPRRADAVRRRPNRPQTRPT